MKRVKINDDGSIKIKRKLQKHRNQMIVQRREIAYQKRINNSIEIKSERMVRLVFVSDEYIKKNRPSAYEYMFK